MPLTQYIKDNTIFFPANQDYIDDEGIEALINGEYKDIEKIHIPAALVNIPYEIFDGLENLAEIDVNPANPVFSSIDGVLFDRSGEKLLCYPPKIKSSNYTLPNKVKSIPSKSSDAPKDFDFDKENILDYGYGFRNNKYLKRIILNDELITLSVKYAFLGCNKITLIKK